MRTERLGSAHITDKYHALTFIKLPRCFLINQALRPMTTIYRSARKVVRN